MSTPVKGSNGGSAGSRAMRRYGSWAMAAAIVAVVAFYGLRAILTRTDAPARLIVYAFSTQGEVFNQGIFPAFERAWEAETGRDLTIEGVFGASGTLAGQINLGAPAHVAVLSNAHHTTWLRIGRRIKSDTQPTLIASTPMVIVTRRGNPAGIRDYADLAAPGLRLLHADPRSSGAGDWAVLAEYGSALAESGDSSAAELQLKAIWRNVRLLSPSAREALTLFELGAGDAFVTYEQDARLALERHVPLEIVVPARTIVAQHAAVQVDDNLTSAVRPIAQAFLDYLVSDAGQRILRQYYLRPVNLDSSGFPGIAQPFTVEFLGGWSRAYEELIEGLWQTEIAAELDLEPPPDIIDRGE